MMGGIIALFMHNVLLNHQKSRALVKLAAQEQLTEQYASLAEHRKKQLDDLHALALEHNKRLQVDEARLAQYQSKIEELTDYIQEEMADRDNVCLDLDDAHRLHKLWNEDSNTHSP